MRSLLCRSAVMVVLCLGMSTSARGQVITGASLFFDHTSDEQAFVQTYQVCVGTDCRDIGVTRVGTTVALAFPLPAWVPRGRRDVTVRAVWKAPLTGASEPTNVLTVVVVGKPERLRTTEVTP